MLTINNHLDEVVANDDALDLEGLAVGHELGPEELDGVEVEAADGGRWQWAVHQGVGVHPRVPQVPQVGHKPARELRHAHFCTNF